MPELHSIGTVRLSGPETESNSIPADVLIRVIEGMQQAALIVAAAQEGRVVAKRFKPTAELRAKYALRCAVPIAGSYALPLMTVHGDSAYLNLINILKEVSLEAKEAIARLIPDLSWRAKLFSELVKISPRAGELWLFGFTPQSGEEILLSPRHTKLIKELAVPSVDDAHMPVTGELLAINFDKNSLTIKYKPTGTEIECVYDQEIEDTILEKRRDHVQVTGKFVLKDGHPVKLTDVTSIEPVDLSPITFNRFDGTDVSLLIEGSGPLVFTPTLDETEQLMIVEMPELNIHAFAPTRDQLVDEVKVAVLFNWNNYALESPNELTEDAKSLRLNLLSRLRAETVQ